MAGKKRDKKLLEFRNTQLADALQTQDMAALAFALAVLVTAYGAYEVRAAADSRRLLLRRPRRRPVGRPPGLAGTRDRLRVVGPGDAAAACPRTTH